MVDSYAYNDILVGVGNIEEAAKDWLLVDSDKDPLSGLMSGLSRTLTTLPDSSSRWYTISAPESPTSNHFFCLYNPVVPFNMIESGNYATKITWASFLVG